MPLQRHDGTCSDRTLVFPTQNPLRQTFRIVPIPRDETTEHIAIRRKQPRPDKKSFVPRPPSHSLPPHPMRSVLIYSDAAHGQPTTERLPTELPAHSFSALPCHTRSPRPVSFGSLQSYSTKPKLSATSRQQKDADRTAGPFLPKTTERLPIKQSGQQRRSATRRGRSGLSNNDSPFPESRRTPATLPLHRRPVFLRHLSGPPSYPFGAIQSCTMGVKPYSFSSSTPLPGGAQIVPATASRTGRLFPAAAPSDMKLSKLKYRPEQEKMTGLRTVSARIRTLPRILAALPGGTQIVSAIASRTGRLFPAAAPRTRTSPLTKMPTTASRIRTLPKQKCRPDTNITPSPNAGPNRER